MSAMGFEEAPASRFRRLAADREYEERQAEHRRLVAARAVAPQQRNAQGHRDDCVCGGCFEAWLRDRAVARAAFRRAMYLLGLAG